MSNGNLIRDLKNTRLLSNNSTINNKSSNRKKNNNKNTSNKNNKTILKNSTSDTVLNERSAANPWAREKKPEAWCDETGLLFIQSWANDGLTDEEIAMKMGIARSTLWVWCNKCQAIKTAIIQGRDTMTLAVENMLYKCAMGFKYEEDAVTKDGEVVKVERFQPPSAEAQKFILTNRRKDKWKSKNEVALEAQIAAQASVEISKSDSLAEDLFGDDEDNETV